MRKKIFLVLWALTLFIGSTSVSYAYIYYSGGHTSASFYLQNDCTTTIYDTAITNSKNAWSSATSKVSFLSSNDTNHYHGIENYYVADSTNAYYSPGWYEYVVAGNR